MGFINSLWFDFLTDPLGLPIEAWKEWIILGIIGIVAYKVAYYYIGELFNTGFISSSVIGSLFHWLLRLFIFVIVWAVTYGLIWIWKWVGHFIS